MCGCAESYHYLAHIIMPFSSDCWLPDGGRGFVSAFGVGHVSMHWEAHTSKVCDPEQAAGHRPRGAWLSPAPSPSELLRTGVLSEGDTRRNGKVGTGGETCGSA